MNSKRLSVLLAFSVLGACGGGSDPPSLHGGQPASANPQSLESGMVALLTTPLSRCVLQRAGNTNPSHALVAYADYQGVVRFAATRQKAGATGTATLDCQSGGKEAHYAIDMSAPDLYAPPAAVPEVAPLRVRPPIAGDPSTLSQEDLVGAGYPMRPDPTRSPALYDRWLRAVKTPTRVVPPALVDDLTMKQGTAVSNLPNGGTGGNWAAGEMNAAVLYEGIIGEFYLPSIAYDPNPNDVFTMVNFWAGIGGDVDNSRGPGAGASLIQDGVQISSLQGEFGPGTVLTGYTLWTEYYTSILQDISSITPHVNDEILVEAFTCDGSGNLNYNGGSGCFFVEDVTQNLSTTAIAPTPNFIGETCYNPQTSVSGPCPIPFNGGTAELAMEPAGGYGASNQLLAVSNYGEETLAGLGVDSNGNLHDFYSDPTELFTLPGETAATIISYDTVTFQFAGVGAFNPNNGNN